MNAGYSVGPRIFFGAYGVGALGMAVVGALFPEQVGGQSSWGINRGWQREIASFDVFVALACLSALRTQRHEAWPATCAWCLSALSLLIGSNNLTTWMQGGEAMHLQGGALHVVAAVVGVVTARSLTAQRTTTT